MRLVFLIAVFLCASNCVARTLVVDNSDGRAAGSYATIAAAAHIARAGDRVLIRPGIYRESVTLEYSGEPDAPIVFEAQVPGTVVVTGADRLADIEPVTGETTLYRAPWQHVFAIDYHDGVPVEHHPENEPLWGRAEQVIADGQQLLPVVSVQALREVSRNGQLDIPVKGMNVQFVGAFTVDRDSQSIWMWLKDGSDPRNHLIEASARGQLFGVNPWQNEQGVHDIHVEGLIFRYGASFAQRAAVWLHGHSNVVKNCIIESMAGTGVCVNGSLIGCIIRNNGHTGGSAVNDESAGSRPFINESCIWEGNCWKPIDRGWDAGGVKIAEAHQGVFRKCVFRNNGGPGLWLDINVHDITIEQCIFENNEESGLMVEISHDINVRNNLFKGNAAGIIGQADWGDAGVKIAESYHCRIVNNTFVGNLDAIGLREQGPRSIETAAGMRHFYTHDVQIERNLVIASRQYAIGLWYDNRFYGPHPDSSVNEAARVQLDPRHAALTIDRNEYVGKTSFLEGVPWRSRHRVYTSLTQWQGGVPFDAGSHWIKPDMPQTAGWSEAPRDIQQWIDAQLPDWLNQDTLGSR